MDQILERLVNVIKTQQEKIDEISELLKDLNIGGGGSGNATISDYESGKLYKRNTLVVDVNTETVYRVLTEYTSDTIENDYAGGYIKLVGYESQIVTFNHNPSQTEINNLPDDTVVVVYSPTDAPYTPSA